MSPGYSNGIEGSDPLQNTGTFMTPKEQYEARKAERKKVSEMEYQVRERTTTLMMLDMLDRFVSASERIADALERTRLDVSAVTERNDD